MEYVGHFQMMEDAYLRERATDILDLGTRILAHLQGNEGTRARTITLMILFRSAKN